MCAIISENCGVIDFKNFIEISSCPFALLVMLLIVFEIVFGSGRNRRDDA